jgi:Carboxypeptidase regulatory-like domain
MRRFVFDTILVWGGLLLLPAVLSAQGTSTGAIAGTAKDSSGAVLPGVTVEASSPALIEKIRTTITDDKGEYKIIELRPGTYAVTFTLPGFNTFKRDGLELTPNFTATINAVLAVGAIQETVTVSGTTPLIDTQNVTQQRTFSRELLDAVPTAKSMLGIASLMPSVVEPPNAQDVGGSKGERSVRLSVHGSKTYDSRLLQDGMRYNALTPGIGPPTAPATLFVPSLEGTGRGYYINPLAAQETVIDTGSLGSAQYEYGGAQVSMIPKDGGNSFSGSLFFSGTGRGLQSNNLTDDLMSQGLTSVNAVRRVYDVNGAFGGRIVRDRIWFFGSARRWGTTTSVANLYADANLSARGIGTSAASWRYAPDLDNPIYPAEIDRAAGIRFTVKPSEKDKFTVSYDRQRNFQDQLTGQLETGTIKNEANAGYCQSHTLLQGTWTRPQSTKLLLDAGTTVSRFNFGGFGDDLYLSDYQGCGGGLVNNVLINDTSLGYTYNGVGNRNMALSHQVNSRFNVSYLTGGHSIKTGLFLMYGLNGGHSTYFDRSPGQVNGLPVSYSFNGGVPRSLTQFAAPTYTLDQLNPDLGLFVQDQWRAGRFTINAGLRLDWVHESVPAISEPAGPLVPARSFAAVDDVPNWKDLNPRFGVAWDPFNDGKTAIKAGINRYVLSNTTGIANFFDPANASVNSTTRSWTDVNGNFLPDCNLRLTTVDGECGAMANANFGGLVVTNTPDPAWVTGWGKRPYMWQMGLAVDREISSNLAVSAGYYHTTYGNFYVLDNTLISPTDFSQYCVTAPTDPRLPTSISGQQICGLYDLNPDKFGQNRSIVTLSSNYGKQSETYDGVDASVNARLRKLTVTGGWNIGNGVQTGILAGGTAGSHQNNCFVVDSPQQLYNCDIQVPFQSRVKFSASYLLPYDVQIATVVQSSPGPTYNATVTYTAAQIQPTLGRPLSGGTATVNVNVVPPFSQFGDRLNQVDLRGGKIFRMGRKRIQANLDLYNLFNASSVVNYTATYGTFGSATAGSIFRQPTQILDGRLVKFSFQLDF